MIESSKVVNLASFFLNPKTSIPQQDRDKGLELLYRLFERLEDATNLLDRMSSLQKSIQESIKNSSEPISNDTKLSSSTSLQFDYVIRFTSSDSETLNDMLTSTVFRKAFGKKNSTTMEYERPCTIELSEFEFIVFTDWKRIEHFFNHIENVKKDKFLYQIRGKKDFILCQIEHV